MDEDSIIRPATLDDLPAIRSILLAHDNDSPITSADIVGPYLRHFVARATALVAERSGEVVAYGASVDAGVAVHLADLFVRPDLLGQGIGRRLLGQVLAGATRLTTFASADPRALPIYVRAGMYPWWPDIELEGSAAAIPAPEAAIEIEPGDPSRLSGLERDWTGFGRPLDHEFWASQADAEALVVLRGGDPVAFAYARARQTSAARAIDRLVVRPGADPVPPTLAAIRHGGGNGEVGATIPGPSPVLPVLLSIGFRIVYRGQFMASEPGLVDPARLVPNGGML